MVRRNRIYTRGGDGGTTSLVGGARIEKSHRRVEAYGTVDELNAAVGVVRALAARDRGRCPEAADRLEEELRRIQNLLFDLGGELAAREGEHLPGQPRIREDDVRQLEGLIDELNGELGELASFLLPGGGVVSAHLHQARTVCRRAERVVLGLAAEEPIGGLVVPFLNRLSDVFFVLSRWISQQSGEREYLWRE